MILLLCLFEKWSMWMPCSKDLNKATIHISLNPIALLIECLKNSTCIFTLAIYDDDIYIYFFILIWDFLDIRFVGHLNRPISKLHWSHNYLLIFSISQEISNNHAIPKIPHFLHNILVSSLSDCLSFSISYVLLVNRCLWVSTNYSDI